MTFQYFGYGSNMLFERIANRCPSVRLVGAAYTSNFRLAFSKKSDDGSGKATLVASVEKQDVVYGVLFSIATEERGAFDRAEGLGNGYERTDRLPVILVGTNSETVATAYIASPSACDASRVPYDWYRDLALAGAIQNGLPGPYVQELRKVIAIPDPNPKRERRLEALEILRKAGFRDA